MDTKTAILFTNVPGRKKRFTIETPGGDIVMVLRSIVEERDVGRFLQEINPKHIEALIALNQLFNIAEAWNKEDGFVPDFSDWQQDKWFPWFSYDEDAARFVYANTLNAPATAYALTGSRICFISSARAEQFGKQFADLYNKVFL